jgi:hypothetical protein
MKAVYIIKAEGYRNFFESVTVQKALYDGQKAAFEAANKGMSNVRLEVYELVAQAPVVTTHVIHIEKVTKP